MTKAEFLKALEEKLSALSAEDRAASLAYYEEIIDDRMEEGLCEADAVAAAGARRGSCGTAPRRGRRTQKRACVPSPSGSNLPAAPCCLPIRSTQSRSTRSVPM